MPVVTSKSIPHQTRMAKPFRPKRRQNITLIDYTTEYSPGVKIRKKVTITNSNLLLTEKYWMSKILPCSRDQNLGLPPQHLWTTKKWPYRWPHFPLRAGIDESKISRKKKKRKVPFTDLEQIQTIINCAEKCWTRIKLQEEKVQIQLTGAISAVTSSWRRLGNCARAFCWRYKLKDKGRIKYSHIKEGMEFKFKVHKEKVETQQTEN